MTLALFFIESSNSLHRLSFTTTFVFSIHDDNQTLGDGNTGEVHPFSDRHGFYAFCLLSIQVHLIFGFSLFAGGYGH